MNMLWRSFLYLAAALVTGILGFALLLAGWLAVGLLAVTPLVVPALLALRWGVGALAELEARLARSLLGVEVGPQRLTSGGEGYWGRGKAVLGDRTFWRQHAAVLTRTVVGWPLAVGAVALVGEALYLVFLVVYYRWTNFHVGSFDVDTLPKALLGIPAGVVGLVVVLALLRWAARGWGRLVLPLLGPPRRPRKSLLVQHAAAAAVADLVVLIVWASVGGPFWPGWVLAATGLTVGVHIWLRRARTPLARVAGAAAILELFEVVLWALGGTGYFWPAWTALGYGIAVAVYAAVARQRGRLEQRIEVLETTRAGAVDVQETDLRRIERDLHDGAQARLVALGMNLGLAEQRLAADPEGARDLVAEARAGVEVALRELRDLARGVHPPVLTDRGLEAAIASLADASAIPVDVTADIPDRPPAVVETAAYFVVAEALANAAKHAGASRISVQLTRGAGRLVVEVADDGRGGADPSGAGLTGLRRRVEALDGTLALESPSGGGTKLQVELPCAS
jgi:signal transduction histidine kinase